MRNVTSIYIKTKDGSSFWLAHTRPYQTQRSSRGLALSQHHPHVCASAGRSPFQGSKIEHLLSPSEKGHKPSVSSCGEEGRACLKVCCSSSRFSRTTLSYEKSKDPSRQCYVRGREHYNLISAFLGWLGALNSFIMGLYILTTALALSPFPGTNYLVFQAWIASTLTTISALILIYGSYLLWRGHKHKGGVVNILTGTLALTPVYTYFTLFSQPPLLDWLGLVGIFLLAPPIIGGGIGILMSKQEA